MIEKIYFDMDGVLADFDNGVRELCHMEPQSQNQKKRSQTADDKMWEAIKNVEHFYDKLKPINGAIELFNELRDSFDVEILTGIPKPKRGITTAAEDKINWVRRYLGDDVKVNVVFREDKPNYCTGPECVLIDDYAKNISEWNEMGGMGILFENVEETFENVMETQSKGKSL